MLQQQVIKGLWLPWMLATGVGYIVGTLAILPWVINFAYAEQPQWLTGLVGGVGWGLAVGIAQWLVLRRHRPLFSSGWIVATVSGATIGLALGLTLAEVIPLPVFNGTRREATTFLLMLPAALNASIVGAVVGLILGSAQWLVLRRTLPLMGWWVLASGLGWMLGMGLGAALTEQISTLGAVLVTGVVAGVITGVAMEQWIQPGKVIREGWQGE